MRFMLLGLCLLKGFVSVLSAQTHQEKSALRFKMSSPVACVGKSIEFKVSLTNIGSTDVFVDPDRIGSIFAFAPARKAKSGRSDSDFSLIGHRVPTHHTQRLIAIGPRNSIRRAVTFLLEPEIFKLVGTYWVRLGYPGHRINGENIGSDENKGDTSSRTQTIYTSTQAIEVKSCE